MKKVCYANAEKTLPSEVLSLVQRYCTGLLYIPEAKKAHTGRFNLVNSLVEQGMSSGDIAKLAGISKRRVNQILRAIKSNKGK